MITDNIVSTPITVSELAQLFSTSQDVGRICTSNKINMWSKNKPVPYADPFSNNDGKGNGNYGIEPFKGTLAACALKYSQANNGWTYSKPLGGATSPYRLGDFRGYKHNAASPFSKFVVNSIDGKINVDETITFTAKCLNTADEGVVGYNDFTVFADAKFGVYLVNGSNKKTFVAEDTIVNSNGFLNISVAAEDVAVNDASGLENWTAYPIIIVTKGTNSYDYYTVHNLDAVQFTLVLAPSASISIKAKKYPSGTDYKVNILVTAKSNMATTLTNGKMLLRHASKSYTDALDSSEQQITLTDTNITAGTQTTILSQTYTVAKSLYDDLVIWVRATVGGNVITAKASAMMFEPVDRPLITE